MAAGEALPLDADFYWTRATVTGEVGDCAWIPPKSSSVGIVLSEFVRSDFAQAIFNNYQVTPTDHGQIRGMFESVRLRDGTLELTMKQSVANVEGLVERLAMYLRVRLPQLRGIHQMHRDGMNIL